MTLHETKPTTKPQHYSIPTPATQPVSNYSQSNITTTFDNVGMGCFLESSDVSSVCSSVCLHGATSYLDFLIQKWYSVEDVHRMRQIDLLTIDFSCRVKRPKFFACTCCQLVVTSCYMLLLLLLKHDTRHVCVSVKALLMSCFYSPVGWWWSVDLYITCYRQIGTGKVTFYPEVCSFLVQPCPFKELCQCL